MEDNTIETSANNVEVADQHEVVEDTNSTPEEVENTTEETTQEESVEEVEVEDTDTKPKQSDADNKAARLARLQAEKEADAKIEKARKEAFEQGKKQGLIDNLIGKKNPYTDELIKDEYDAKEYQDMYEIDASGEDPIKGFRNLQKSRAREEAKKQLELDKELKQKQWYENDTKDFVSKFGEEKLKELTKDPDFDIFAKGKVGTMPLAEIYESFNGFIGKYQKKSVETAKKIVANNSATPGAINDGEHQEIDWNNMSSEQFAKYLQKAKDGELR